MNQFDLKTGSDLWMKLTNTGKLDCESCSYELIKGQMGIAVNCSTVVEPKQKQEIVFTLVWDQPNIHFVGKKHTHIRSPSLCILATRGLNVRK